MNETGKQNLLGPWNCCTAAAVCLVGIVILLIVFVPLLLKRNEERFLRAEAAKVKADSTGHLSLHNLKVIEYLLHDAECKEKITVVDVSGDSISYISDKRLQSLKQFPHLKTIYLEYIGNCDSCLEGIQGMTSLEELQFARAGISAKGMQFIIGFPNLKRISFDERTDLACLDALKGHTGIESLGLGEYSTSSDRLAFIKTLPNLRKLSLYLALNDGEVLDLHGLPKLEELCLGDSVATDNALAGLEEMNNLTSLDCEGHKITDAGMGHLCNNLKLRRLHLMWQPITDAGLEQLSILTGLEDLNLCKTKITDAGLKYLKKMNSLQKLDIQLTNVTFQGMTDLHQVLPNCMIEWRPPTIDKP